MPLCWMWSEFLQFVTYFLRFFVRWKISQLLIKYFYDSIWFHHLPDVFVGKGRAYPQIEPIMGLHSNGQYLAYKYLTKPAVTDYDKQ